MLINHSPFNLHPNPNAKYCNDEGQTPCTEFWRGVPGLYLVNKGVPIEFLTEQRLKELQSVEK